MTLIQVNGAYVNEDLYKFPDPDLLIQSVSHKSDLNALGVNNTSTSNGYVYFYIDKDWQHNTVNYVGETKNSLQYRHNSTHSKKEWFANLKYPLIGIAQSPYRAWDTDTRRVIESLVLQQLKSLGMTPANSENSTWMNFDITGHPEKHYLEKIATMIVEYQLFHLGLRENTLVDINKSKEQELLEAGRLSTERIISQQQTGSITFTQDETPTNVIKKTKDLSPKGIWIEPVEGRKIIAKSRGCTVHGYQTAEGLVVVTAAENIPETTRPSCPSSSVLIHDQILSESVTNENGAKNWNGFYGPDKITKYLSAFFGCPTANTWEEDLG